MKYGLAGGVLWGLDTVVLGIALLMVPFLGSPNAALASAGLHDLACAILLLIYMGSKGRLSRTWKAVKTNSGKAVMGAALLGGPVGMTGYLISINHIGPGYTAVISTFYPAVGSLLAVIILKERMKSRQIGALAVALSGVIAMGYSSVSAEVPGTAWIGVLAALLCVLGWGSEGVVLTWAMKDGKIDNQTALQIRQSTSGLTYALFVLPLFGASGFALSSVATPAMGMLVLAASAGTTSYLFYYKALHSIGAYRGMALNISYSAWAVIFSFVLMGTIPTVVEVGCCLVILIGTVLAASPDWRDLLPRRNRKQNPGLHDALDQERQQIVD